MSELTSAFDTYDRSKNQDGLENEMAAFRQECPVGRTEHYGGMWVVSRYEDLVAVAKDTTTYSSRSVTVPSTPAEVPRIVPIELDPPEHRKYRSLMQSWFSPKAIGLWEGEIRLIARNLLYDIRDGRCDLLTDFARPLPLYAIVRVLGVPELDMKQLDTWANVIVGVDGTDHELIWQVYGELRTYVLETVVRSRRAQPTDDLVSHLLASSVDGVPLTDDLVADMAFFLVLAGFETTVKALGQMLVHLIAHPSLLERIRRDGVSSQIVEELLRRFAGVAAARDVVVDCELGGRQLRAGERVQLLYPSGNLDESVYDDPLSLRFDRPRNSHIAFGYGIHRCLGMELARLEVRIALEELFREFASIRPVEGNPAIFNMATVWGTTSLPALVSRAEAVDR